MSKCERTQLLINENIDDYYIQPATTSNDPILNYDLCIQEHKNGLFVICLSPKHFLCQNTFRVVKVHFPIQPPTTTTPSDNAMEDDEKPKEVKQQNNNNGKKNKQKLPCHSIQPNTIICKIEYASNESPETICSLEIQSYVKGKLVEVNQRLSETATPSLCQTHPLNFGYLAIIDPNEAIKNLKQKNELMKTWKPRKDYYSQ